MLLSILFLWHLTNVVGVQHTWDDLTSMVGHTQNLLGRGIWYDCWGIGIHVCKKVAHVGRGSICNSFVTQ